MILNQCISSGLSGYFISYFNTITFADSIEIFNITQDPALMQGLLSFCIALGAGVGGFISKYVANRFSRKDGNLMCAYMVIIATLMLQSGNIFLIVIGRLVQGLYVGVTSVIRAVYIK